MIDHIRLIENLCKYMYLSFSRICQYNYTSEIINKSLEIIILNYNNHSYN